MGRETGNGGKEMQMAVQSANEFQHLHGLSSQVSDPAVSGQWSGPWVASHILATAVLADKSRDTFAAVDPQRRRRDIFVVMASHGIKLRQERHLPRICRS